MLWHLLGKSVKTIVLLICSICSSLFLFLFFPSHWFVPFFLQYFYHVHIQYHFGLPPFFFFFFFVCTFFFLLYISLYIQSTMPFCWAVVFFFFKFWIIATVSSLFTQLCWAKIHYSTYNFFGLPFCIFFSLHTILSKNT